MENQQIISANNYLLNEDYQIHLIIILGMIIFLYLLYNFIKTKSITYILLILVLFIIYAVIIYNLNGKENFVMYNMKPYNILKTGSDPPHFYNMPTFRKPYRYGYPFISQYPYPHIAPILYNP